MQREDDRDRAIDRALRQSIPSERSESRDAARAVSNGHVDGETLAAWSEGQLRPDEFARIEQHLSDCARCQHLLATFAHAAPPPTVTEPLWRRWHLQWLVPIATAATVAAIWVAIPRHEQTRALVPFADQRDVPAAEPTAPAAATQAPREEATARVQQSAPPAPAESARQNQSPRPLAKSTASSPTAKREEFERRDTNDQLARQAEPAAPAEREPVASQAGTREKDSDKLRAAQESGAAPAAPTPATPAPAPAAPPPASTVAGATAAESAIRGRAFGDTRALAARVTAPPTSDIRSPDGATRWRIVGGGRQIERTTNSGAQWETATLSSDGVVTTGVSPSPSVCWIVGRAGAIYVTTDGLRFVRVMFPESIDLIAVTATDARHATVMSADRRSFRTDDGGMSWTR